MSENQAQMLFLLRYTALSEAEAGAGVAFTGYGWGATNPSFYIVPSEKLQEGVAARGV